MLNKRSIYPLIVTLALALCNTQTAHADKLTPIERLEKNKLSSEKPTEKAEEPEQVVTEFSLENSEDEENGDDDVFIVDAFTVVAAKGYQSTHTTSASLFAEEIGKTPVQISVLTPDFMDDIGATDINDALQYATNVKTSFDASGSAQSYTVRGLQSNRPTRNFLNLDYAADRYNISTVEVLQGPAALQYGRPDPGGLVNLNSKIPSFINFTDLEFRVGSEDFYRGTFDLNTYTGPLAIRINGVYEENESWRLYEEGQKQAIDLHLLYQISENTKVRLEIETGEENDTPSRSILRYNNQFIEDTTITTDTNVTVNTPFDAAQSHAGPDSFVNNQWTSVELTFQNQAMDDRLNTQLLVHQGWTKRDLMTFVQGDLLRDDGTISGFFNGQERSINSLFTRLDTSYEFELGENKIRLLTGARYDSSTVEIEDFRDFRNAGNAPNRMTLPYSSVVNGDGPRFGIYTDPAGGYRQFRDQATEFTVLGGYVGFSGEFLNNRLFVQGGIRHDVNDVEIDPINSVIPSLRFAADSVSEDLTSMALGFVYKITENIGFFANYGESANLNLRRDAETNEYLAPRETSGIDLGFKYDMFDSKLTGSIYVFHIENKNTFEVIPTPLAQATVGLTPGGAALTDQLSEGFGIDFVLKPFRGFTIRGGYGFIDVTREGGDESLGLPIGQTVTGNATHNANIFFNYAFQNSTIKGLSVGAGANYRSAAVAGYLDSDGDNIPDKEYTVDGYVQVNAVVSYFKKFDHFDWRISLNVNNVLDTEYVNPINLVFATRSQPRTFFITNKFSF